MKCTTYDDCYDLLCYFLQEPMFIFTTISPNYWNGTCDTLNNNDDRSLTAEFDLYSGNKFIGYNVSQTVSVSEASILLCNLILNKSVTNIMYYPSSC